MKRFYLHLVTPIAALVLAACSEPELNDAGEEENSGDTAVSVDTEDTASATWTIAARAFGPFDPSTPYTPDALAAALPGYTLVESQLESEGAPYPVTMAVPEGGSEPVIVVAGIPDTDVIFAVAVREPGKVDNPAGQIGQTFSEAGFESLTCWPGAEERSGDVVCLDARNSAVGYWLDPQGYEGPDGELPPAEILADATIYEIRWTPPAE